MKIFPNWRLICLFFPGVFTRCETSGITYCMGIFLQKASTFPEGSGFESLILSLVFGGLLGITGFAMLMYPFLEGLDKHPP